MEGVYLPEAPYNLFGLLSGIFCLRVAIFAVISQQVAAVLSIRLASGYSVSPWGDRAEVYRPQA